MKFPKKNFPWEVQSWHHACRSLMYDTYLYVSELHGVPHWVTMTVHRRGMNLWDKYRKVRNRVKGVGISIMASVGKEGTQAHKSTKTAYYSYKELTEREKSLLAQLHG